ncbi:MAG: SagB family peptide dehydrogenase [Pirellulaceae bacterium]
MIPGWMVSLRDDVAVSSEGDAAVTLQNPVRQQILRQCPPPFHSLLERMVAPGVRYTDLTDLAFRTDVPNPLARLIYYLQFLAQRGWVVLAVESDDHRLVTFEPTSSEFRWPRVEVSDGPYLLSRFAYLHRDHDRIVLESPLALGRVIVHDDRIAAALFALRRPASLDDIAAQLSELSREAIAGLVTLLCATNILTRVDDDGEPEEAGRAELQTWEFHDLLFHARSRIGRHDAPMGATYRFFGKTVPPPAVKSLESENGVELVAPTIEAIRQHDSPLNDVVERRQSIRAYADRPITMEQLSEFLYRTARIRRKYNSEVDTPHGPLEMEFVSRPYPSGGALYELDVYPLIQRCDGLNAGLYRYDASNHRLVSVSEWTPQLRHLVIGAGLSTGISSESIQVVLILSSRFSRLSWKYASMAYALTLKHVGVLYQTMYLTATAMGLAPCAMGAGDADVFARAIGSEYYAETSVGEFLLGSKA